MPKRTILGVNDASNVEKNNEHEFCCKPDMPLLVILVAGGSSTAVAVGLAPDRSHISSLVMIL